jgi:hypothetical protein
VYILREDPWVILQQNSPPPHPNSLESFPSFYFFSLDFLLDAFRYSQRHPGPAQFFRQKMEKYGEEVAAETAGVCVCTVHLSRRGTRRVKWDGKRRGERNKNLRPGLVAPDPSNPAHTHLIIKSTTHTLSGGGEKAPEKRHGRVCLTVCYKDLFCPYGLNL